MIQILAFLISVYGWAAAPEISIVTPKKTIKLSLTELKSKLPLKVVEIDDPVYKAKKSYDGFLLSDVFNFAGLTPDESADEIVFTAKDGYAPNMGFAALKKHGGALL